MPETRSTSRRAALLRGFASVFDVPGSRRRRVMLPTAEEALAQDWWAIGDDLRVALRRQATSTGR